MKISECWVVSLRVSYWNQYCWVSSSVIDSGINCTLSQSADHTKLSVQLTHLKDRIPSRETEKLKKWAHGNPMLHLRTAETDNWKHSTAEEISNGNYYLELKVQLNINRVLEEILLCKEKKKKTKDLFISSSWIVGPLKLCNSEGKYYNNQQTNRSPLKTSVRKSLTVWRIVELTKGGMTEHLTTENSPKYKRPWSDEKLFKTL